MTSMNTYPSLIMYIALCTVVQKETLFRKIVNEDKKKLETLYLEQCDTTVPVRGFGPKLSSRQAETIFSVLDKNMNTELHTLGLDDIELSTLVSWLEWLSS